MWQRRVALARAGVWMRQQATQDLLGHLAGARRALALLCALVVPGCLANATTPSGEPNIDRSGGDARLAADASVVESGSASADDAGSPGHDADLPPELGAVRDWLRRSMPSPAEIEAGTPLLVVLAAGTNNHIRALDLQSPAASTDPIEGDPDTAGLPWWSSTGSDFQAGQLALAALQRAGWAPCQINSTRVRFVLWGFGTDTAGLDFYLRAAPDVGTDLSRVHSLGGDNAALDGVLRNNLPAYTARSLDTDARALMVALEAYAKNFSPRPQVVIAAHSWGAAYAGYFLEQTYATAAAPSFTVRAAILAAAPRQVLTHPLEFDGAACPPGTETHPLRVACSVPDCIERDPAHALRSLCVLGAHADTLRSTPVYSLERPDDPLPATDPDLLVGAWNLWRGTYPGIAGHDYLIRDNAPYDRISGYSWDASAGAACDPAALQPVACVRAAGPVQFRGIYGVDTLQLTCAIGFETGLYYASSCDDANRTTAHFGIATDDTCGATLPGVHAGICLVGTDIDPASGVPVADDHDTCFVTSTQEAPALVTPATSSNRRVAAGFVNCRP